VKNVHSKLKGLTKGFADINGALQVTQQAFGMAQKVAQTFADEITRLDKIGDIAARFDITAVSVQKLQRVIQLSGGDVESLTKVLGRLQVNLGDAAGGKGSAVGALKALNLRAEQFQGLSLDQTFETIVRSISRVPDAAARAAIATDILGKSAIDMMEIFTRDGVFEQATKEVNEFGVAMDNAMIENVGRAAEAMERLEMTWKSLKSELTLEFAPYAADFMDFVNSGMSRSRQFPKHVKWQMLLGSGLPGLVLGGQLANLIDPQQSASMPSGDFGFGMDSDEALVATSKHFREQSEKAAALRAKGFVTPSGVPDFAKIAEWLLRPNVVAGPVAPANDPRANHEMRMAARELVLGVERQMTEFNTGSPGALEFGSAAAFSAINQARKQDEVSRLQKQEVEESKKTNKILERMLDDATFFQEARLQG
jgi:hypothetical protein